MKFLLTAFLFVAPFLALAKEPAAIHATKLKHPVKPALWKIEGKNLTKPSYLFGTIHLGDPRITTLHPKAEKAFQTSDRFYAEIDMDPAKQVAIAPLLMRTDGKILSESIGPKLTKRLNKALKAINPDLDSKAFEPMKTWVVTMALPTLKLDLSGGKALDAVLYERAISDEKKVGGIETVESQLKIFDDLTEKEQISLLSDSLKAMKKEQAEGKDSVKELLDLYLASDVKKIGEMIKEHMENDMGKNEELGRRLMKTLLDDRNITMTDTIAKKLSEHPGSSQFFAVGAAHYTGKSAIQDLLTKKGYTITPAFK
ncbi:TraB/GumN family protein [bacterium]|jgi:uncharacterized protein YbaP (TraB family)|nr:TraB/GumN family protein [Akkermansiaceae bacterium]MDB4745224.1 TraB/GumN family protein [bacterium]